MTKFKRSSKALGVTIPTDLAAFLNLKAGDAVDLDARGDGTLVISRHVNVCRFCGGAENVKRFGDVFICPECAERLHKEVCGA